MTRAGLLSLVGGNRHEESFSVGGMRNQSPARRNKTRDEQEMSIQLAPSPTTQSPGPTAAELVALLDHLPALVAYWDTDLRNRFCNAISQE